MAVASMREKLSFDEWLALGRLSPQTQRDYYLAISQRVSAWAKDAGLIEGNLLDLSDAAIFSALHSDIEQLAIYVERNTKENNRFSAALRQFSNYLHGESDSRSRSQIEAIRNDTRLPQTEKEALIKSRIGQGRFRRQLFEKWERCALLGVRDPCVLTASHIKPWSESNNEERLNVYNGLLLCAQVDRAFDRGLISFEDDGGILISERFLDPKPLGLRIDMRIHVDEPHIPFLEYHREHVYRSA